MERLKNFINGEYAEPQAGKYLPNINPATAQVINELPDSDELDVVTAIGAAKKAFESWSKTSAKERSAILNKVADGIESRKEEFAQAESLDVGKALWLSKEMDIPRSILNFRFFASSILHKTSASSDMDGKAINYVLNQAVGVAGLVSPWNLPLYLLSWKIAPCLASGNTAVCKPSELTPTTAFMLGEVFNEAGLPPGVCNIILGTGEKAGATLVKHPGVPLISFTGGTDTGEVIQSMSAPHFKKLSLELGGKNANIIFKDADLKKAISMSLRSSFLNQGEICLCGSRILVQQDIYDEFVAEFVKQVKEIKVGDPFNESTFMGPVVSKEHQEKVLAAIKQAEKENGKILCGGKAPQLSGDLSQGYFIEPTVIADLTNCSDLWQKEIFGPVVTLMSFKYAHEAVKWANTSPFGLSASIWTKDLSRAHKVAANLNVGTVWVNTWLMRDLKMPFGGMKASGLGREGGEDSFDFFHRKEKLYVFHCKENSWVK